jgi:hypothetical protein
METAGTVAPGTSSAAVQVLQRINRWRTSGGGTPLSTFAHTNTSSSNHANYCAGTPQATCWATYNNEVATCAGFTGVDLLARLRSTGFTPTRDIETFLISTVGPNAGVDALVWQVFARRNLFENGYTYLGYARASTNLNVYDVAGPMTVPVRSPATLFPAPGQTGVPLSLTPFLNPRPPAPAGGFPSGAVVSASFSADGVITTHELLGPTCALVGHVFSNSNGAGGTDARYWYLYANTPLASGARYTVHLAGTVGGASWSRAWTFTTQ